MRHGREAQTHGDGAGGAELAGRGDSWAARLRRDGEDRATTARAGRDGCVPVGDNAQQAIQGGTVRS